jgi:hypothetical protein
MAYVTSWGSLSQHLIAVALKRCVVQSNILLKQFQSPDASADGVGSGARYC